MGRPPGSKNKSKEPGIGHNSQPDGDKLKSLVNRIEELEAEKASVAEDVKALYLEAKSQGIDTVALRAVIKMRRQDAAALAEREAVIQSYMRELGMLVGLPLGDAALQREFGAERPF